MEETAVAWKKLEQLGHRQHGVVTSAEAQRCGLSRSALRWRITRGELVQVHEGVFTFSAARRSWEQRAMGAVLWLGPSAALSHASAASVLCLDGFKARPSTVEVLVPHSEVSTRRLKDLPQGLVVHRSRTPFESTTVAGLRVTDLTRTLLDLAQVAKKPRGLDDTLDDALDSAQRMYPGTDRLLEQELKTHGQGRAGAARLSQLLEARAGLSTESALEARVLRAIRRAGLPPPKPQVQVSDGDGYVTRLDFAWAAELVALHVDGYAYHQQRTQFEGDRIINSRLTALKWASVWVTHRSVDGDVWLRALRTLLERRAPQQKLI